MRRPTLALLLIVLASAGCMLVPPEKIPVDRLNYMNAVSTSWKEQLLNNLVKLRYGEPLTCLEMTSISTTYALDSQLTANYPIIWHYLHGVTSWTSGARNTVTPSGTLTYQDHPSISYIPMRGDELEKTMLEPILPSRFLKSLQTGWNPGYVFSCCLKSINGLQNHDDGFFKLVELFGDLMREGVIRITLEAPPEEKKPEKEPAVKVATESKNGKNTDAAKDKNNEEKEVTAVGYLVLDLSDRVESEEKLIKLEENVSERKKMKEKIKEWKENLKSFKKLLCPNGLPQGEDLYSIKCCNCHGEKGDGKGPNASDPKPADFTEPKFWMGDVDQKIDQAVKKDHEKKFKLYMKDDDLNAVIAYIKQAFGNYEVYKIIDGNQYPLQPGLNSDKIFLRTRSILQVLIMLSEFIHVPKEDLDHDRASPLTLYGKPLNGPVKEKEQIIFKIESDKERPKDIDTFAAIRNPRGYWFYIEDTDFNSKQVFSFIEGILSMTETTPSQGTPLLTLPVQ